MDDEQEQLHVFVGGLHRSGTSIVARCLAQHPEISGFAGTGVPEDEGQFLQTVYPAARVHGGPGRFAFDERAHLTEASPLATAANADRLRREWGQHWDLSRSVLLEKSPPNLLKTRFLQALFPGSRFIVVVRHPVAVALAVKTRRPRRTHVDEMLRHWVVAHERFAADRPLLEHVEVVRYEAFVRDPDASLAALFEFIGLPPVVNALPISTDTNQRYYEMWRQLVARPVRGLPLRRLERALEPRILRFGYSLVDDPGSPNPG